MTDLLNRLSTARPSETELQAMWPETRRQALLDRIEEAHDARPSRHRYGTAIGLVAAAATAFLVIPAAVDTPSAAATDLRSLALSAASYEGSVLEQGTWLHEQSTSVQRDSRTLSDGAVFERERETWTRWDGRTLLIERDPSAGWTSYDVIDGSRAISDAEAPAFDDPASYQDPTPQFAAALPDTAEGLLSYLDGRVFGSSSHEEAMYSALVGLATSHTLPPDTLAATYEALATVEGVTTDDVRVEGQPAVEVGFSDDVSGSVETMTVDAATGQVLAVQSDSSQSSYTSTTTLSQVVPEIPAAVVDAFSEHDEGIRYNASGDPMPN